jgi:ribosome biogenesis GTPase / thiamine phosphate phosphatase
VLRVAGPTALLWLDGAEREAGLLPRLPGGPLVVGDRVEVRRAGEDLVVTCRLPRTTELVRAAGPEGATRTVVANADLMLVVESLAAPPPRPHLVDRYLVAAHVGGLEPAVVFTKLDLVEDAAEAGALVDLYRGIGYTVLDGSSKDPAFVARIRELVDGRVGALVGRSGAGKSTITRGLTGVQRAVGAVGDRGGRHTTTDPRLLPLPGGGAVVDTAGVRTLFLPPVEPDELVEAFPEIAAAAAGCRFRDCRHMGEAGCAVPGRVPASRLESYRRLAESLTRTPRAT